METIINPQIAYLLIFTGVMLLLIIFDDTKSSWLKVGAMVFCLVAGVAEFFILHGNPWAFLIVVLSPLPYYVAMRQARLYAQLFIFTIFMLSIGSAYLFVDDNGRPLANLGLTGMVSVFGGLLVWLIVARRRTAETEGKAPLISETLVGMIGEVWVAIEPSQPGSVRIEGDIWRARSKQMIPAGTMVRVISQTGITLTVKKVEYLPSNKK